MTILQQPSTVLDFIYKQKAKGLRVGFVPTMGALHQGHLELIKVASQAADFTVVSIFVNPTQFNDPTDYQQYPDRRQQDIHLLAASGTGLLYMPPPEAIYPSGLESLETYDLGHLEQILEGKFRPGHFQGVCQVMSRLLETVGPDLLFMGQKDFQQCMVVKKLIELKGLPVELVTCPTIREKDGLAMSSRNLRLSSAARSKATAIYDALVFLRKNVHELPLQELKQEATTLLERQNFKVDYVEVADASTLRPLDQAGDEQMVGLVAAFLDDVRLIDNMLL